MYRGGLIIQVFKERYTCIVKTVNRDPLNANIKRVILAGGHYKRVTFQITSFSRHIIVVLWSLLTCGHKGQVIFVRACACLHCLVKIQDFLEFCLLNTSKINS